MIKKKIVVLAFPLKVEIKKENIYVVNIVSVQRNYCDTLRSARAYCELTYGRGHPACQGLGTAVEYLCKV
ncbi:hypothetical protein [Vulcanisaeta distributa]|uniref:hypothetical protein n=1 Tax=Vulcanisaeta distributa TaxID=164451 RepID=UPI0006D14453|nr:hypothetical protein [Vulcanisaeta distributa]